MAISQSTVHANLNRDKILNETWWCYYCLCGGTGLGPVSDPLCAGEEKNLCIRGTCTTTDLMTEEGLCGGLDVFLCMTSQSQIPPMTGSPKCVCFNKKIAPGSTDITFKTPLFDYKQIFDDTFWVYYIFCLGCGLNGIGKGRPIIASQGKCLCAQGGTNFESPVIDGTFCASVGTQLCFWGQCQCPPAPNNPKIACCGWKMNKGGGGSANAVEVVNKPGQEAMELKEEK